ncbi:hypothetical protein GCM10010531_33190 [Blastococcus jejuensis]|uniref:Uncharacterized protein n=1 Tax=Blastococcus jejuensis TaxID=351224 RepID=A0ABP6PFP2_9ACTN
MSEKNLFGTTSERARFEEKARERRTVTGTATDALTPTVVLLIVSPSLLGTTFIG